MASKLACFVSSPATDTALLRKALLSYLALHSNDIEREQHYAQPHIHTHVRDEL